MGGYGSTRWRRHYKKVTAEQCVILDAAYWTRLGILGDGIIKTGCQSSIRYYVNTAGGHHPRVHLTYDLYNLGREHLDYPVFLLTTQPQFGGLRWWFQCPLCRRRVQKLFLPPRASQFGCRECHKLSYTTRNQHPKDRLMERARAIRMSLDGSVSLFEPFPPRPKGMCWKTYLSLEQKYERYNQASLRITVEWLDRMRKPRKLKAAKRKVMGFPATESWSVKPESDGW
jgi:hypothetical protein